MGMAMASRGGKRKGQKGEVSRLIDVDVDVADEVDVASGVIKKRRRSQKLDMPLQNSRRRAGGSVVGLCGCCFRWLPT